MFLLLKIPSLSATVTSLLKHNSWHSSQNPLHCLQPQNLYLKADCNLHVIKETDGSLTILCNTVIHHVRFMEAKDFVVEHYNFPCSI